MTITLTTRQISVLRVYDGITSPGGAHVSPAEAFPGVSWTGLRVLARTCFALTDRGLLDADYMQCDEWRFSVTESGRSHPSLPLEKPTRKTFTKLQLSVLRMWAGVKNPSDMRTAFGAVGDAGERIDRVSRALARKGLLDMTDGVPPLFAISAAGCAKLDECRGQPSDAGVKRRPNQPEREARRAAPCCRHPACQLEAARRALLDGDTEQLVAIIIHGASVFCSRGLLAEARR